MFIGLKTGDVLEVAICARREGSAYGGTGPGLHNAHERGYTSCRVTPSPNQPGPFVGLCRF